MHSSLFFKYTELTHYLQVMPTAHSPSFHQPTAQTQSVTVTPFVLFKFTAKAHAAVPLCAVVRFVLR